jgi:uncharacterized membrane protein (UPF0182 family)
MFDDEVQELAPEPPTRSRALVITAVVLVLGFFALTTFASFYTERLWFSDIGFLGVFSTLLWTRVSLFAAFGLLMATAVAVNIVIAYRLRPLFAMPSPEQAGLDRYRAAIGPIRTWLVLGTAVLMGLFAGTSGAGQWRSFMLWRNGGEFGETDPYFKRDIGFFVFDLPWLHYLVDVAMAVAVVCLMAAAVVHYLYGGIRLQSPGDRMTGAAQAQISVLLGIFVLAKAGDYYLDRYDLVHQSGSLFTGIGYTGDNAVLPAKSILMGIALVCAVLFFLNVWRRTWLLPSMGLALLVLSAILLGLVWPGFVQTFQVRPSEADRERPFIEKHIAATNAAYDIDDVLEERLSTTSEVVSARALDSDVGSIPVIDPQLVRQTFEQNQQARAYYTVADVLDVDRYEIDGKERALVIGARELFQPGISAGDQNWLNLHTVYTHGNGIIAAYANQRDINNITAAAGSDDDDRTQWAEGNAADQYELSVAVGGFEGRVYFGEVSPEYSVVGKPSEDSPDVELDLQRSTTTSEGTDASIDEPVDTAAGEPTTTYDGETGVAVGTGFRKLLYAIRFGSTNFLLSDRVHENSRVLYHRDPSERVRKVAPWLAIDDDVYPAIVPGEGDEPGRILWVVDGYTTTDRYPGSERESFATMTDDAFQENVGLRTLPTDEINYIRNAVKATVDAYDGTVTLYEWDETDPMLKAWRSAFPGTVRDKSEIPEGVLEHLRYPEDLFKVQRYQYARYHVTDPNQWFQGNDRWEVPEDPNAPSTLQAPYRMFSIKPGESVLNAEDSVAQTWSIASVFVPFDRKNLAAYFSVDSDATSDTYGQMRAIDVLDDQTDGPGQIANQMRSGTEAARVLGEQKTAGNTVTYGNVLTIPVKGRLLNVEPVYVQLQSTGGFPILRYVLVAYNDRVGIGTTLIQALSSALLGQDDGDPEPVGPGDPEPSGSPTAEPTDEPTVTPGEATIQELLDQAQAAFDAANLALAAGDLGEYQEQVKKAEGLIAQALDLADQES